MGKGTAALSLLRLHQLRTGRRRAALRGKARERISGGDPGEQGRWTARTLLLNWLRVRHLLSGRKERRRGRNSAGELLCGPRRSCRGGCHVHPLSLLAETGTSALDERSSTVGSLLGLLRDDQAGGSLSRGAGFSISAPPLGRCIDGDSLEQEARGRCHDQLHR